MLDIQEHAGAAIFSVRVQPRASKDELVGEMAGALKVRLQAPAVENRANDALVGVPRTAFENAQVRC